MSEEGQEVLLSAFKYSYLNAKARTMHSKRLMPSDWHILESARGKEDFLHYLATTSYGEWVSKFLEQREQSDELFERGIFTPLFEDYSKLLRSIGDKNSKELVLALFSRFEAENLKIVLRAIFTGLKKTSVAHLLYPVEPVSRLRWEGLWQQPDIPMAVKFLERTPFGNMLKHALPQFQAQGRLFPMEMAIDIACFRRISKALEAVSAKLDRKRVSEILGPYIDVLNICHIVRLRFIYRVSPEEALNYSFPGGKELGLKALHKLARAEEIGSLIHALPATFRVALEEGEGSILSIKKQLEEWLIMKLRKAFLGNPFHIGVPIAHLIEKEMETRGIISLYEAKAQGTSIKAGDIIPAHLLTVGGEEIVQAS